MQLNTLRRRHELKGKKRIGRGGKRGKTSGRGQKGQKSRAGRRIKPAEKYLIQRLPKLRGFGNITIQKEQKCQILNLKDIDKMTCEIVNPEALLKAGLIKNIKIPVKILGDGNVKKPLKIENIKLSNPAKEKILSKGGKII